MKPGRKGIKRLYYATLYSIKGLKAAWLNEAAFRQEFVVFTPMTVLTFFLPVTQTEQLLDIGSAAVLVALLFAVFSWCYILAF